MSKEKRHYLQDLLDYLQITAASFAKSLGYDSPNKIYYILRFRNGMSIEIARDITRLYPSINYDWLLTGEGDMLKGISQVQVSTTDMYKLVPLVNLDAVGGMHKTHDATALIPFIEAHNGDVCIRIATDSMSPTCPPGCIVQIREVPDWKEYFGYGGIFVIQLKDGRRIIKEVTQYEPDPKNYVLCVSHNKAFPAEELPKSFIVGVWKVVKVLIDSGW